MRKTVGEALIDLLEQRGVDTVFGIPGVHTAELYRGLAASRIRHVTPRHELGAGFMADGYARASGKPGVCLLITGPGVANAITAMAQARADSVPILVISGVNPVATKGLERGLLHELPDQSATIASVALLSQTLDDGRNLAPVLDRAFAAMLQGRPGPVHIEIPLDVMEQEIDIPSLPPPVPARPELPTQALDEAAQLCRAARAPVLILGGGAVGANAAADDLARKLDAPVVTTVNGRGLLAGDPLEVPASPSLPAIRELLAQADLVVAAGTQFGQTDYDMYVDGEFPHLKRLIRIEIDPTLAAAGPQAATTLLGDAGQAMAALASRLDRQSNCGVARAAAARNAVLDGLSNKLRTEVGVLDTIQQTLPGCLVVGDSTQLVYAGNLYCHANQPRGWFNSATGFGSLGYGAPAAVGAQLARPDCPVVCLTGDGGFQFCLSELGTAKDEAAPVIFLVWNNHGYQEIENYMQDRGIAPIGVRPSAPDFYMVAKAYGIEAEKLDGVNDLDAALLRAREVRRPYLIEILID
ncbi:MAG: 5-guanidino-2-oxopentanoate decarboxylase [Sphingomonadales bacterium]|nr:5-guanidino-2-oxopentanoate decarboxylase [Sphingomonadales bacterium]